MRVVFTLLTFATMAIAIIGCHAGVDVGH